MKAIQAAKAGAPEVLLHTELPTPVPGEGEVLVKVEAAGVNFIDIYRRAGVYAMAFPHVPGCEGAGTVEQVGAGVDLVVGQRVVWIESASGSYAEYALVKAAEAVPVPSDVTSVSAAAVALQGITADFLVRETFPVGPGDTVVLFAAAGGVGSLATQMILGAGARLIAVVGSAAKITKVTDLGVAPNDVVVLGTMADLTTQLPAKVRELTAGQGADVVYDGVGRATFAASLDMCRPRGMVVLFGGASGQVEPFDPQELNAHGSLYLTRPKVGDYTATPEELHNRAGRVLRAVGAGSLAVSIGSVRPLHQAAQAHRNLEARQTTGKIVLTP